MGGYVGDGEAKELPDDDADGAQEVGVEEGGQEGGGREEEGGGGEEGGKGRETHGYACVGREAELGRAQPRVRGQGEEEEEAGFELVWGRVKVEEEGRDPGDDAVDD